MADVIVRPAAETDLRDAALWYESQQPGLGSEFTLRIDAVIERIAQNSIQFPEIENGVSRALLQRLPYAIYFVVAASPVVIAVLHQRRHPVTWKPRL